jgi:hypothetical protein
MQPYYLLLANHPGEPPWLIKRCHTESKAAAAQVFADRLNSLMGGEVFTASELLSVIKQEDELTDRDYQWMRDTAPELLEG